MAETRTITVGSTKSTVVLEDGTYPNPKRLHWGRVPDLAIKARSLLRESLEGVPFGDMESVEDVRLVLRTDDNLANGAGAPWRGGTPKVRVERITAAGGDWGTNVAWVNIPASTGADAVEVNLPTGNSNVARFSIKDLAKQWFPASVPGGGGQPNYGVVLRVPNEAIYTNNGSIWGTGSDNGDFVPRMEIEFWPKVGPEAPYVHTPRGTVSAPYIHQPAGTAYVDAELVSTVENDYLTAYTIRLTREDGLIINEFTSELTDVEVGQRHRRVTLHGRPTGPNWFIPGHGLPHRIDPRTQYRATIWMRNKWGIWSPPSEAPASFGVSQYVFKTLTRPWPPTNITVDFPADNPRKPLIGGHHNDADPGSVMSRARAVIYLPEAGGATVATEKAADYPLGGMDFSLRSDKELEWGATYAVSCQTWDEELLEGELGPLVHFTMPPRPPDPVAYDTKPPDSSSPRTMATKAWTRQPVLTVADSTRPFTKHGIEIYRDEQTSGDNPKAGEVPLKAYETTIASALTANKTVDAGILAPGQVVAWRERIYLTTGAVWTEWGPIKRFPINALPRGPVIVSPAYGAILSGPNITVEAKTDDPDAASYADLIVAREFLLERRTSADGVVPEVWTTVSNPTDSMLNTALAAAAAAGATNITVDSVTNATAADPIAIGPLSRREFRTIAVGGVGTIGSGGTGLTLTEALGQAHTDFAGTGVVEILPTTRAFTGLTTEGEYALRLRDLDQNSEALYGDWSNGNVRWRFWIRNPPVVTAGAAVDDTDPSPLLDWSVDVTQVSYVLTVDEKLDTDYLPVRTVSGTTATEEHQLAGGVLKDATTYRFRVTVTAANGLAATFTSIDWTTNIAPPDPMATFTATPHVDETRVALAWTYTGGTPDPDHAWTDLERAIGAGSFESIANITDSSVLAYYDDTATTNRELTYRIRQSNGVLDSPYLEAMTALTIRSWFLLEPGNPNFIRFRVDPGASRDDAQRVVGVEAAGRQHPVPVEDVPGGASFSFVAAFHAWEIDLLERMRQMIRDDAGRPGLCLKTGNGYSYDRVKFTAIAELGESAGRRRVRFTGFRIA